MESRPRPASSPQRDPHENEKIEHLVSALYKLSVSKAALEWQDAGATGQQPPPSLHCVVGVCAMDKKTKSPPMKQILDRLRAYGEFDIVVFGNQARVWPAREALEPKPATASH